MLKNKKLLIIAFIACLASSIGAQTNSPYSRYGYGILRDQAVGPSKAMGGVGYGLRHAQSANPMNPASYSRVDSLTFLFDIGLTATYGRLSDGVNSKSRYNGGLDYITILFPVTKGLGVSLGVLPYSTVGYKFGGTETLEDSELTYAKSFAGSGGLSQVYLGAGYKLPVTGLSLGANVSYLFGTINHSRSLPSINSSGSYTSSETTELSTNAFKFDIGLQYELSVSEKDMFTLGAVFSPKINSKGDYQNTHYVWEGSTVVSADTTSQKIDAGIPSTYGLGLAWNRNNKLIVGADVTYQKWSDLKYEQLMGDDLSASDRFNDRWKYAVGAEYIIDPYDRSFFKRIKFRGGLNYSNSYMNVMNSDKKIDGYNEYGATFGFGLPVRDNLGGRFSYININFEYKKLKPKVSNMIDEQYFGVSVNMNINELWFFRKKID